MSNKQARLVAAVADAMNDQGFTQKALATAAGMSAGTLSAALSGRYNLSDVKWQLVCEALALDYDDIVAPSQLPEELAPEMGNPVEPSMESPTGVLPAANAQTHNQAKLCARYLAEKLRADVSAGTDMSLDDLYVLLSCIKRLEENAP